jgi:hypothetical protein
VLSVGAAEQSRNDFVRICRLDVFGLVSSLCASSLMLVRAACSPVIIRLIIKLSASHMAAYFNGLSQVSANILCISVLGRTPKIFLTAVF